MGLERAWSLTIQWNKTRTRKNNCNIPIKFFKIDSLKLFAWLGIKDSYRRSSWDFLEHGSLVFWLKVRVYEVLHIGELEKSCYKTNDIKTDSSPCSNVIQSMTRWRTCTRSCPPTPRHSRPPPRPPRPAPQARGCPAAPGPTTLSSWCTRVTSLKALNLMVINCVNETALHWQHTSNVTLAVSLDFRLNSTEIKSNYLCS